MNCKKDFQLIFDIKKALQNFQTHVKYEKTKLVRKNIDIQEELNHFLYNSSSFLFFSDKTGRYCLQEY